MTRGRKRNIIPRHKITLYLRVDLLSELELIIADPLRDKAKYGERSAYFERLVEADLAGRRVCLTTDTGARTMSDRSNSDPSPVKEPDPDGTDNST